MDAHPAFIFGLSGNFPKNPDNPDIPDKPPRHRDNIASGCDGAKAANPDNPDEGGRVCLKDDGQRISLAHLDGPVEEPDGG